MVFFCWGLFVVTDLGNVSCLLKKEIKKEGCGSFLEKVAIIHGVTQSVVSWYDKIVTLLSNFVGSEPVTEVKRFSKSKERNNLNQMSRFNSRM